MKPRQQLALLIGIVSFMVMILLVFIQTVSNPDSEFYIQIYPPTETPTTIIPRTAAILGDFKQLWVVGQTKIGNDSTLGAASGRACFLGSVGIPVDPYELFCLDGKTGLQLLDINVGRPDKLIMTKAGLFVLTTSYEFYRVRKYDMQTGKMIWNFTFDERTSQLNAIGNEVWVLTYHDVLWIFDLDGNVIRKIKNDPPLLILPDLAFYGHADLIARSTLTDEIVWECHRCSNHIRSVSPLTILSTDENNMVALDRVSGQRLWLMKMENISSNAVYSPSKHCFYMLGDNGALFAIDERSGEQRVMIQFSAETVYHPGDLFYKFDLAYDEDSRILFVSLGNSSQLFAFQEH